MKRYVFLLIFILFILYGCKNNDLIFIEYEKIQYNGEIYLHNPENNWRPKGGMLKDVFQIHLIDYKDELINNKKYEAKGFEFDDDRVFLMFNSQLYIRENYKFIEDIQKQDVDLIYLCDSISEKRLYTIDNSDTIKLLLSEYKNQNGETKQAKRIDPKQFHIKFVSNDYFATFDGCVIGESMDDRLGFLITNKNFLYVNVFSDELNSKIFKIIKKEN